MHSERNFTICIRHCARQAASLLEVASESQHWWRELDIGTPPEANIHRWHWVLMLTVSMRRPSSDQGRCTMSERIATPKLLATIDRTASIELVRMCIGAVIGGRSALQGVDFPKIGGVIARRRFTNQDDAQAVIWFRKAALQGHPKAQNNLGLMYEHGRGTVQDYAQAIVWLRKAAEQGDAAAENNIGLMFEHGLGVPRDIRQAVAWYRKADEHGNPAAKLNLQRLFPIERA